MADYRQRDFVLSKTEPAYESGTFLKQCRIVAVGGRRGGGTRYWCLRHRANATAKYGTAATTCRTAHLPPITAEETLDLNIDSYDGGVALWGAVPPVYDTTTRSRDGGIHIHARAVAGELKKIDDTFRAVKIFADRLPQAGMMVSELDAVYYMVTSIFGCVMKYVGCSHCGYAHLDRDWFSVHPHRRHLCAACGRHFWDTEKAVGNPICGLRDTCVVPSHDQRPATRKIAVRQKDFGGGIQIWGSNPAFVWTGLRPEEEGIHVHAFRGDDEEPEIDETYSQVAIDGVELDPMMVRVLMAQETLPYLKGRVLPLACKICGEAQFDKDELAFTPVSKHRCRRCGCEFVAPGRLRKTVANPLIALLEGLAQGAPRQPQEHEVNFLSETP